MVVVNPVSTLIDAFAAWERWALRISTNAQTAIDRGERPPRLNANAGKEVSDRLVDAEVVVAGTLGVRHTDLHDRVVTARRAGHTVTESVNAATEAWSS